MNRDEAAPRTQAEIEHAAYENYKIPVEPFKGTADEIERQWYEQCYRGRGDSLWQLTWRAVLMGSLLGGLLSVTNIYIGLKAGWGFGVSITACILSYAIWTMVHKLGLSRTPMTILENNCMQTAASAAGYSTGGTLISAFAAYILLTNQTIPIHLLMGMVFFLAILGVTMAVPMKRQMVNMEQLKFPSGVAAAETLKALHSKGDQGMRSAAALGISALFAMCSKFWVEGFSVFNLPEKASLGYFVSKLNLAAVGAAWVGRTVSLSWDLMFIAAGAITGMRVCLSMMFGAVLCWMVFVPIGLNQGFITMTVVEKLPVAVVGADFTTDHRVDKFFKYDARQGQLKWEGVMTADDRAYLLAQSSDPWYQNAVERLYIRSQFRAASPLASEPTGLLDLEGAKGALRYDAGKKLLIMPEIISRSAYEKLKAAGASGDFGTALDNLYARSRLPSYEPLWASTELAALPKRARINDMLGRRLVFDADAKRLLWRGAMTAEDRAAVEAVSDDATYQNAVRALAAAAAARTLATPVPESLHGVVRYDEAAGALYADGPIDAKDAKSWSAAVKSDPAASMAVENLIAASGAVRAHENFRDLVAWSLWGGTGCMVTSGLLAFALQWKSALRAFAGLGSMLGGGTRRRTDAVQDEMDAIETPAWWFVVGQFVGLAGLAWLCGIAFHMPIWMTVVAVLLSFVLAIVACRVTGETDTTPIGAMGKIMQLTFAGLAPGNMIANLMSANITAGSAGSSAALLTDLKSGYLLGAHPRKQFLAQFSGIFIGTLVTVTVFSLLVPNADAIGNDRFPAPAALVWKAVAEALGKGLGSLHPIKLWGLAIGGAIGIILPLLSMAFPKAAKYLPSAAGLGLAWTFPWYNAFMFFVGAVIGWILEKRAPKTSSEYTFTVASGLIAGESLMGAGLAVYQAGPAVIRQIFAGG